MRIILILALVLSIGMVHGQSRSDLKGPKAKNFKPWKQQSSSTLVYSGSTEVKGPKAKNRKSWKKNKQSQGDYLVSTNRRHLKGPIAKNYRSHNTTEPTVKSRFVIIKDKEDVLNVR